MTIKTRLDKLEASACAGERVIGITYTQDWREEHPPGIVKLIGRHRGEQMRIEEFERRYPGGTLIRVEFVKDWRNDHQTQA